MPGDAVYVITVRNGKLLVGSKIIVGKIGNKADAAKIVGTFDLWEAEDHVIAAFSTPRRWDLVIPNEVTERLEFVSADGKTLSGPLFESAGFLDKQTLRHLRQLTPESAALLDRYLDPLEEVVFTPQSLWVTDS